jgi:hypothetical protein
MYKDFFVLKTVEPMRNIYHFSFSTVARENMEVSVELGTLYSFHFGSGARIDITTQHIF